MRLNDGEIMGLLDYYTKEMRKAVLTGKIKSMLVQKDYAAFRGELDTWQYRIDRIFSHLDGEQDDISKV